MAERTSADRIARHRAELDPLSDDELVRRLEDLDPLPQGDDDDAAWDDEGTWDRAERLIAFADAIGDRRLAEAILLVFERASLGDAYGLMQGIRHGAERAVAPEWGRLVEIMRPLARHNRAGCRRWAVVELGILRDPTTVDELLLCLDDQEELVREEACKSVAAVGEVMGKAEQQAIRGRLEEMEASDPSPLLRDGARRRAKRLI